MNCEQVKELLPLYAGLDLEEKGARLVAAHIESCAECTSSANEYRESRQLLQLFEPPPFGEEVYAGIRQRALREIGREPAALSLRQLVASMFRGRLGWAVASALLLAVALFAFYAANNRTNDHRRQVADSRSTVDGTKQEEISKPGSLNDKSHWLSSSGNTNPARAGTGRDTGSVKEIGGSVDRTNQSQRRRIPRKAADNTRSVAANIPVTLRMTAEASAKTNNLAEPEIREPIRSEKPLRMEMQTKDPNIRIIWFSRQPAKQDSPGSKGI